VLETSTSAEPVRRWRGLTGAQQRSLRIPNTSSGPFTTASPTTDMAANNVRAISFLSFAYDRTLQLDCLVQSTNGTPCKMVFH
jgi:hypothetical protein